MKHQRNEQHREQGPHVLPSAEIHRVSARFVVARDGVAGLAWFTRLHHDATHFALDVDELGFRSLGCVVEGSARGRPAKAVGVESAAVSIFFCLSVKRILRRRRPFFFAGGLAAMR